MKNEQKVLLVAVSRTAIGSLKGKQARVPPEKLAAHVLVNAIRRAGIVHKSQIDKIVFGHCVQSYFAPNTARFAALNEAGLPASIDSYTVQKQCASGMQAAFEVWRDIKDGRAELGIACGVESMSYTPLIISGAQRFSGLNQILMKWLPKQFKVYGPLPFFGLAESGLGPMSLSGDPTALNMIKTAQTVANICGVTRQQADEYALLSQKRAIAAQKSGRLALEIDPFIVAGAGMVELDEYPRATSIEALSSLKDVAGSKVVTAGNAAGMGCGAAALVLASEKMAEQLGATPLAELADFHFTGRNAVTMGLGPVKAVQELLVHNGLESAQIGYTELNPAFGVQALACLKLLNLSLENVNHNGDAISLSHPLGMTGARLIGTAAYEMSLSGKIDYALATLCVGGGMGAAALLKKYLPGK